MHLHTVIIEDIQELFQVYRRCILGVRPKAFQIEDIAECKSSSNDQKSNNNWKIMPISSIWKRNFRFFGLVMGTSGK